MQSNLSFVVKKSLRHFCWDNVFYNIFSLFANNFLLWRMGSAISNQFFTFQFFYLLFRDWSWLKNHHYNMAWFNSIIFTCKSNKRNIFVTTDTDSKCFLLKFYSLQWIPLNVIKVQCYQPLNVITFKDPIFWR